MKRILYIGCMWLATLMLASCEEKLPEFEVTTLSVQAEWQGFDLHLSSNMNLASGIEIQEQGFVVELPVNQLHGYWQDSPDTREKRTIRVPVGESLDYTLSSEGWGPDLSCTAYAYIKTNAGNYRSAEIEKRTQDNPPQPKFTKITYVPTGLFTGILTIEGKYFNGSPGRVELLIDECTATVTDGGPGRIVAECHKYHALHEGEEYEVKVKLGQNTYTLAPKWVVEGIRIVSTEPEHPKHGELVKMYLENYTPGTILGNSTGHYALSVDILEEAEGYITFRVPEYPVAYFDIALMNNFGIFSKPYRLEVKQFWQEQDLEQAGWPGHSFNVHAVRTYHAGKTYLSNEDHTALMVFDSATKRWKSVAYPDLAHRSEYWSNVQLFGHGDYLYLFLCLKKWNDVVSWQQFYRMHVDTETWELYDEVDASVVKGDNLRFAATNGGIVYVSGAGEKLMQYDLNAKTWKAVECSLRPDVVTIIGGKDDKVYYYETHYEGKIYGVNLKTGEAPVQMLPSYYNIQALLLDDQYLYIQNEWSFSRVPLDAPGNEESLGILTLTPPFDYDKGQGFLIPAPEAPYVIWNTPNEGVKFYRYNPTAD